MDWQLELYHLDKVEQLVQRARRFLGEGEPERAASALDRAYGLDSGNVEVALQRSQLLGELAREHQGMRFSYVPGGYFLMGSQHGDPDEQPVHPVRLDPFWISETPVDWAWLSRALGYAPPPIGRPERGGFQEGFVWEVRQQYCEEHTRRASDWHNHFYEAVGEEGWPYQPDRAPLQHSYSSKPAVAVHFAEAERFCQASRTRLPSEAEWEKAARGGLIGQTYAWGSQPPTAETCDFHRFTDFNIRPVRELPPNGYGLYGMCGGVWEWTSSRYDALAYSGRKTPRCAEQRVVRGGCWADCAEAVTVSFRSSRPLGGPANPNQGFRVCLPEKLSLWTRMNRGFGRRWR